MNDVENTLKVYVPILAAVGYFAGFHYINSYFSFFGIKGMYQEFALTTFASFSALVLFETISLRDASSSWLFLILIIAIVSAIKLPHMTYIFPQRVHRPARLKSLSITPTNLTRYAIIACFSLYCSFWIASNIGRMHACETVSKNHSSNQFRFENKFDGTKLGVTANIVNLQNQGELVELWRNKDFLLLAKKVDDCRTDEIVTYKLRIADIGTTSNVRAPAHDGR